MNIELTGENKIRFVDNYGDSYDAEVSYDAEIYIPISLFNEINKKHMEE